VFMVSRSGICAVRSVLTESRASHFRESARLNFKG
jgi:hypothetical protein